VAEADGGGPGDGVTGTRASLSSGCLRAAPRSPAFNRMLPLHCIRQWHLSGVAQGSDRPSLWPLLVPTRSPSSIDDANSDPADQVGVVLSAR
jgi:hypothetical protein